MSLPPHRTQGLLAALLLRPGPQRRERLIGLLFPAMPETDGRRKLSHLLWLLRRSLPALPLESDAQNVQFRADARWLDVETFRRAAASSDLTEQKAALDLYTGDLLEGFYDDWLLQEREALHLQYLRLLHCVCSTLLKQEQPDDLLPLAERLVQAEPYDEGALRTLMTAYQAVGRRGAALAAYDRFRALAADELGAEPEPATRALADALRSAVAWPRQTPPPAAADITSASSASRFHRALALGDRAAVEQELQRLRASNSCTDDEIQLLEIDAALSWGKYERADRLLGSTAEAGPAQRLPAARLALGRYDVGRALDLAAEALMNAHGSSDSVAELGALLVLAQAQQQAGQQGRALRTAERALVLARRLHATEQIAEALNLRAFAQIQQGRYGNALSQFHEARAEALEHGLRRALATALRGIRLVQVHTNRLREALQTVQEELGLWRDMGLQRQEAEALEGLALVLDYLGCSADSLRAMEQALEISRRSGDSVRIAISQYNMAYTLLYQDDANARRAATEARAALNAFRTHQQPAWEATALTALGYALWVDGQHAEALVHFREAYATSEQVSHLSYLPELLAYQGLASLGLDLRSEALALTRSAVLTMAQGEVSQEVVPEIYYAHASALAANGMDEQAGSYFVQAYEHLLNNAAQLEDEAARQAFFYRNPTMRRLMRELQARGVAPAPSSGVVSRQLPASRGERPVQVHWTVDAGPPDAALRQAKGAIALRRSRLLRLLHEADAQGAAPTRAQVAEALGVSERTIQRDLAAMRDRV